MKTSRRKNERSFGQIQGQRHWGFGDIKEAEGIFDVDPAQAAVLAALLTKAVGEHYSYDRRGKEPPIQIAFGFGETRAPFVRVQRQKSRVLRAAAR